MKDKELRKLIGSRAKQRRLELNLTQPYVAEKMGVTASTILRYENGSIDNTKKMVLEGLSEALHVSIEWLRGETDEYETDITDKKELQIRDAMGDILKQLPLDLSKKEDAFSKDLLLLMLKQYNLFLESFQFACKNYKGNTNEADIAKVMGFESNDEYNEIMFLREITHTVNAFNDMADVVRLYSKKPEAAEQRLENLLSEVLYENMNNDELMREAIRLSIENVANGGGPFGAVIARDGEIIATGVNRVTANNDPTAHAEVSAIRSASQRLDTFNLSDCEIFTSCEPCPMCLGAIYWARLKKVYYANTKADAKAIGFDDSFIYDELALPQDKRKLPAEAMLRNEAIKAFEAWQDKEDKTEY